MKYFVLQMSQYGKGVSCPNECRVFLVSSEEIGESIRSWDELDVALMTGAYSTSRRRLSKTSVNKLVKKTKGQHWGLDSPTIGLTESDLMKWEKEHLVLTDEGIEIVEDALKSAKPPIYY